MLTTAKTKACDGSRIKFPDYIEIFKESNPEIPEEFYGENLVRFINQKRKTGQNKKTFIPPRNENKWASMLQKMKQAKGPSPDYFNLPRTEAEWTSMMNKNFFIKKQKKQFFVSKQKSYGQSKNLIPQKTWPFSLLLRLKKLL